MQMTISYNIHNKTEKVLALADVEYEKEQSVTFNITAKELASIADFVCVEDKKIYAHQYADTSATYTTYEIRETSDDEKKYVVKEVSRRAGYNEEINIKEALNEQTRKKKHILTEKEAKSCVLKLLRSYAKQKAENKKFAEQQQKHAETKRKELEEEARRRTEAEQKEQKEREQKKQEEELNKLRNKIEEYKEKAKLCCNEHLELQEEKAKDKVVFLSALLKIKEAQVARESNFCSEDFSSEGDFVRTGFEEYENEIPLRCLKSLQKFQQVASEINRENEVVRFGYFIAEEAEDDDDPYLLCELFTEHNKAFLIIDEW